MTKPLTIILLFLNTLCNGQKALIGLFGKCDKEYSGYMCQQILFNDDKTYIFYDLLHLRGWTLTKGTWEMNGDTVILKSLKQSYGLEYRGTSFSDNITIYAYDSISALPFATIAINSHPFSTNLSGTIKYPRKQIDTISVIFLTTYTGPILIDKEEIKNIDTIAVRLNLDYPGEYSFKNGKWLLKKKKLYHTQDSLGGFNSDKYFNKVKKKDMKYRKANNL